MLGSQCTVLHFTLAAFNVKCKCGQCADFFFFSFLFPGTSITSAAATFIPFFAHLPLSVPSQIKSIRECGMSHQTVLVPVFKYDKHEGDWERWGGVFNIRKERL